MDYAALNQTVKKHKAALTRAKNKGPEEVLKSVEKAYEDFDKFEYGYPDNWHLWEIAKNDALMDIKRSNWRNNW